MGIWDLMQIIAGSEWEYYQNKIAHEFIIVSENTELNYNIYNNF